MKNNKNMKILKTYNIFNETNIDIYTAFKLDDENYILKYISDYSNDINIIIDRDTLPINIISSYESMKDKVLDNPSLDVTLKGEYGKTLLMFACQYQQLDSVKKILKHKQNINELDDYNNDALIWLGPEHEIFNITEYYELTELMLKNGAKPNQKNINDLSSLEMIYQKISEIIYEFSDSIKFIDLIKLYFNYGADVKYNDIIHLINSIQSFDNIQEFIEIMEFYILHNYKIIYEFIEKLCDHLIVLDKDNERILKEYIKTNFNIFFDKYKKREKSKKFNL
jgi:ankyrin repeat protein